MKFLLQAKHWQLFLVMISPLFVEFILVFFVLTSAIGAIGNPEGIDAFVSSPAGVTTIVLGTLFFILAIISAITLFGWNYVLATSLYPKLPAGHNMKISRFKVAFFYPVCYMVVFLIIILTIVMTRPDNPFIIFIIFPFHFLAMFCMFYVLYYVSKSLKTVELQRTVTFGDYAGEFFLMWFYFIGVWFIQPRVNAMFAGNDTTTGQPLDQYQDRSL